MANIVKCPNGHFFDMNKFKFCPHCGSLPEQSMQPMQPPVPPMPQYAPQPVYQQPYMQPQTVYQQPYAPQQPAPEPQPQKAEPAAEVRKNDKLTVGWLVCVDGKAKGRSFPLRETKNYIGSSAAMDIVLDDEAVSADKHAVIAYDPKQKRFAAVPGDSRELYYVNDQAVFGAVTLSEHDLIEIGSTKLVFVKLCSENFSWSSFKK